MPSNIVNCHTQPTCFAHFIVPGGKKNIPQRKICLVPSNKMRDEILQPLWVHPVTRQIFANTIGFYFLQHPSPGHMKVFNAYLGIFWGHQVLCYLLTQLLKHRLKASVEVDLRPRVSRGKVLQKITIYWQKKEIGRTLPWDQAQVALFQDIFALRDVAHCRPPPRRHGTIVTNFHTLRSNDTFVQI